jgi:hypothetical protein
MLPDLVLPAIVTRLIMRRLALYLLVKIEKGSGYGELPFDFNDGDSMVYECKEPRVFCSLGNLFGDFSFAFLEICGRTSLSARSTNDSVPGTLPLSEMMGTSLSTIVIVDSV